MILPEAQNVRAGNFALHSWRQVMNAYVGGLSLTRLSTKFTLEGFANMTLNPERLKRLGSDLELRDIRCEHLV